ncbi:unnamed protein product [Rhodiola kirilowii]
MERYRKLEELGDGTCGTVFKAMNLETSEIVAVKKMKRKFFVWEECINLREVKALCKLNHPNIIKLKEIVRENNELFFIFEYMEHNLYEMMTKRQGPFQEQEIRYYMSQILEGLAHMHKFGYFHRDLKPENLLVKGESVKIADFGLAREVMSNPPYTDYVSTRWYRAPEVLLQCSSYTPAIDMWAVGTIMAELFTLCPIFPGDSEVDQLHKICCVLGAPNWNTFSDATNISRLTSVCFSEILPTSLSYFIPSASPEALDLIMRLCSWDPMKRPTAEQALQHPFFSVEAWPHYPVEDPYELKPTEPNLELNLWNFDAQPNDCFLGLTLAVNPSATGFDMIQQVSQGMSMTQDMLFCSSLQNYSRNAVLWSLLTPDASGSSIPIDLQPQLALPFSSSSHAHHHPSESTSRFSLAPTLPSPLLSLSIPCQHGHCR